MWSGALNENGCAPVLELSIGSYVFRLTSIHEAPGGQSFTTYYWATNPDFPLGPKPVSYKTGFKVNLQPSQVIQKWIEPVFQTAVTNVSAIVSHLPPAWTDQVRRTRLVEVDLVGPTRSEDRPPRRRQHAVRQPLDLLASVDQQASPCRFGVFGTEGPERCRVAEAGPRGRLDFDR